MKKEIKGLDRLTEKEQDKIKEIIKKETKRFTQFLEEPSKMKFFVQTYSNEGNNKKTSIHLEIKIKTRNFEADDQSWKSIESTKKCFTKIKNQIEHQYHVSDTHHAYRKKPNHKKRPKEFKKRKKQNKDII